MSGYAAIGAADPTSAAPPPPFSLAAPLDMRYISPTGERVMIQSYCDKRTTKFAAGDRVKAFSGFVRQAEKALDRLDAATDLRDLAALPGNRIEALAGDRAGQHSIRINDQWRVCFEWPKGSPGPQNVEIVDYH